MKLLDTKLLKEELEERYPNVLKKNKQFWKFEFIPFVDNFIQKHEDVTIICEEDSPFQVERCTKCNVMVVYGDHYCSNCGTRFEWR